MLYICPTPIGNMEDITLRVLNTLKKVDYIACEDTRHSAILLNYYDIHKPLISLHEHNEMEKREEIIRLLAEGNEIALVSDAGSECCYYGSGSIQFGTKRVFVYRISSEKEDTTIGAIGESEECELADCIL